MNNFEYVDYSTTTRRAWTRAREIHRQKLIEIVRTPSKKAYTPIPHFISNSKSRKREQINNKIQRENSLIFKKISDTPSLITTNLRSRVTTPKLSSSLYGGFETRTKEKIKQENRRIAKKIISAGPSFSIKKLKKDYKEVEKLKKNICKPHSMTSHYTLFPIIRGRSLQSKKISDLNTSSKISN